MGLEKFNCFLFMLLGMMLLGWPMGWFMVVGGAYRLWHIKRYPDLYGENAKPPH